MRDEARMMWGTIVATWSGSFIAFATMTENSVPPSWEWRVAAWCAAAALAFGAGLLMPRGRR